MAVTNASAGTTNTVVQFPYPCSYITLNNEGSSAVYYSLGRDAAESTKGGRILGTSGTYSFMSDGQNKRYFDRVNLITASGTSNVAIEYHE